jgi:hypothetical protein
VRERGGTETGYTARASKKARRGNNRCTPMNADRAASPAALRPCSLGLVAAVDAAPNYRRSSAFIGGFNFLFSVVAFGRLYGKGITVARVKPGFHPGYDAKISAQIGQRARRGALRRRTTFTLRRADATKIVGWTQSANALWRNAIGRKRRQHAAQAPHLSASGASPGPRLCYEEYASHPLEATNAR